MDRNDFYQITKILIMVVVAGAALYWFFTFPTNEPEPQYCPFEYGALSGGGDWIFTNEGWVRK